MPPRISAADCASAQRPAPPQAKLSTSRMVAQ